MPDSDTITEAAMRTLPISSFFSVVLFATSALGGTVLIDFGIDTQVAPTPYNQVTYPSTGGAANTGAVALTDTTSAPTSWFVTVADSGAGNGGNAGSGANVSAFPAAVSSFHADALKDSLYGNGDPAGMTVTIAGLDTAKTYDLLFYGSRNNNQNANQQWSLSKGTPGANVTHGSFDNSTVVVDWDGVSPDGTGVIEISIDAVAPDSNGALALNFGQIIEVPEPSTFALSVFGLVSLIGLGRRRKR
jgi:hypothetical protein